MPNKTIGITGAAGYIGSRVTKVLAEAGYDLILADNFSHAQVPDVRSLGIKEMDVRNISEMSGLVEQSDIIIHLAAISDVEECENNPEDAFENNVVGTQKIAWQCRQTEKPLVFPLSMQTLGTTKELPLDPDQERQPANFYGVTKAMGEDDIKRLAANNFSAFSFIKSNVYGNHTIDGKTVGKGTVINYFVGEALKGNDITVYRPGTQVRDFIHVKDVAKAYRVAVRRITSTKRDLSSYFIATGQTYTIQDVAYIVKDTIEQKTDKSPAVELVENPRDADNLVQDLEISMEKTHEDLGFKPEISLEHGIESLIVQQIDDE